MSIGPPTCVNDDSIVAHERKWETDLDLFPPRPFRVSNDALGDPPALRERLADDGYLFFRGCLDRGRVASARRDITRELCRLGWLEAPDSARPTDGFATHEGQAEYWRGLAAVLRLPSLHAISRDEALSAVLADLYGEPFFPQPRRIPRIKFPAATDDWSETPAHQDYPYMQGTLDAVTAWTPLADSSIEDGALEILAGSHRYGIRPMFGGTKNRCAATSVDPGSPDWHGGDVLVGDVILFTCLTVHRARPNRTGRVRLSLDGRYQPVASPVCEAVLRPAFYPNVPDWDELLPERDAAAAYQVPAEVTVVPFQQPGTGSPPAHGEVFTWLTA